MIAAAIDLGANTILMTIGKLSPDGSLCIIRDEHAIARLGAGLVATGNIGDAAIIRASEILRRYKAICDQEKVDLIGAVGASALRDAANSSAVCAAFEKEIGVKIRVIDGETEASYSFSGTIENDLPALLIDIGGGSTEIIAGRNDMIEFRRSANIGAVRLTEQFFPTLPPDRDAVSAVFGVILQNLPRNIPAHPMTAVAGSATTLAAIAIGGFSVDKIHGYCLNIETIKEITARLLRLALPEILAIPGVHPRRADIIPAGAAILQKAMELYGYENCSVSARGLRFGVLKEILRNAQFADIRRQTANLID